VDRRMAGATLDALAKAYDVVMAEPIVYSNPYTIAGAVRRTRDLNEGATEPEHPWSDAVGEDQV
jgi:gamma-glutamyltranspeptidase / glutathione hydrolase